MPPSTPVLAPAEVFAFVLGDLALILLVAKVIGEVFVRLRQPRVVGEIIAGILIGPTVLGGRLATATVAGEGLVNQIYPLPAASFLTLVGQIGLVLYMFLVGLELDQHLLKGRGRQIAIVALAAVLIPVALGFLVGAVLTGPTWQPADVDYVTVSLFLGAGLSVTAFPVMARILQEKGLIATAMGAVGIGAAAAVTVLMFLAIAAATASARGAGIVEEVGLKVLLTAAFLVALAIIGRVVLSFLTRGYREGQPVDQYLAVLLPLALAAGLAADRIGINALVGGFLFGLSVPARPGLALAIINRMQSPVVLFFLPVFLAVSGLRTDLKALTPDLIPGALLFLVLMVAGKWGVGYLAARAVGMTNNQGHILGVLLNCRGLLILVVALIGLQLGVLTPAMQAVFVVGAIVTTLMTGPLVDRFIGGEKVSAEADRKASGVALISG